jgi:hypothetical protein
MLKRLLFVVLLTMVAVLVSSLALAGDKDQYDITISKIGAAWHIAPCPLPGGFGDTWRFINASPTVGIVVKVWNQNNNTVTSYAIPASGNAVHTIAVSDCEVKVFDETDSEELVECIAIECRGVPTLTQWGIIALVILILGSAVFVMVRRKKSAVPA